MKYTLKNRPHNPSAQWKFEDWFKGFEKELREKYNRKEFFSIARWELLKEILGE